MKELLIWAGAFTLIDTATPPQGWLAIFVLFICLFGCWMCHDLEGNRQ